MYFFLFYSQKKKKKKASEFHKTMKEYFSVSETLIYNYILAKVLFFGLKNHLIETCWTSNYVNNITKCLYSALWFWKVC